MSGDDTRGRDACGPARPWPAGYLAAEAEFCEPETRLFDAARELVMARRQAFRSLWNIAHAEQVEWS